LPALYAKNSGWFATIQAGVRQRVVVKAKSFGKRSLTISYSEGGSLLDESPAGANFAAL